MNKEPVLTAASVSAAILALLALLGVTVTDAQVGAIEAIVAVVLPLVLPVIAGLIARGKVMPVEPGYDPAQSFEPPEREERPPGRAGDHDPDAR